jgi:uncharacterized protein (TIGR00375 family)
MQTVVDLHSHSGYAGGVGQIELSTVAAAMKMKGINVFGTGDCLLPQRSAELKYQLQETASGIFSLPNSNAKFLLQTEVIFSSRLPGYKNKTIAHHIILFPGFKAIEKMNDLMQKWGMKNTIGRPFITSNEQKQLEDQFWEIKRIDPLLEIIPAHIMTPEGVLGSRNNLSSLVEFYGDFLTQITTIETGLSADPAMLERIPELTDLTFISNSDCHSTALNRIGREFTVLDVNEISYPEIINALRNNQVVMTAEFNPAEGRFFLTGHREDRQDHQQKIIFDKSAPTSLICPDCGRMMNLGVQGRCLQLQDDKIVPLKRNYIHLIPLVEVIANSLEVRSVRSVKVERTLQKILEIFPTEIDLWRSERVKELLDKRIAPKTINRISAVQEGKFYFDPPGYDGVYGKLIIGE